MPTIFKQFIQSSPYLSALDVWHSRDWNFEFDGLDFFPSLNWIFAVKSSLSNWKFQTRECQNSSADR